MSTLEEPRLLSQRVRGGLKPRWEGTLVCPGRVPRAVAADCGGVRVAGQFRRRKKSAWQVWRHVDSWRLEIPVPAGTARGDFQIQAEFTDGHQLEWTWKGQEAADSSAEDGVPEGLTVSWDFPQEGAEIDSVLTVSGWIARPGAPPVSISCFLDDRKAGDIVTDVPRPDVRTLIPALPDDLVGFEQRFSVKPSLTGGAGRVSLRMRFADGREHEITRALIRTPFMDGDEARRVGAVLASGPGFDEFVPWIEHRPLAEEPGFPKILAFCELDSFWGTGFAEWRRVLRAGAGFPGQVQPVIPLEGNFSDPSFASVWAGWAELARNYGIGGLCVEFATGKEPWIEALAGIDGLPYCFFWNGRAEPDWSGIRAHFSRAEYLTVAGKPLALVASDVAQSAPGEALVISVRGRSGHPGLSSEKGCALYPAFEEGAPPAGALPRWRGRVVRELGGPREAGVFPIVRAGLDTEPAEPCRGTVLASRSPDALRKALYEAGRTALEDTNLPGPLVFVDSWNRWLESSHLEPDHRRGHARLQAVRDALEEFSPVNATDAGAVSTQKTPAPYAVIVHLYYRDLWEELAERLESLPGPFFLHVSVTGGISKGLERRIQSRFPGAVVHDFPNHGRDVLPFFRIARTLREQGVDLFLKLHSKKSTHRVDGVKWRQDLYDRLMGNARNILGWFAEDPRLGMAGPAGHLLSTDYYVGGNQPRMEEIARLCGLPGELWRGSRFFAGTMFWGRLSALAPVMDLWPDQVEFEAEAGQTDGTLGHAVERMFLPVLLAKGYRAKDTDGGGAGAGAQDYAHAANG